MKLRCYTGCTLAGILSFCLIGACTKKEKGSAQDSSQSKAAHRQSTAASKEDSSAHEAAGKKELLPASLLNPDSPADAVRSYHSEAKGFSSKGHDDFMALVGELAQAHRKLVDKNTIDGWAGAGHIATSVYRNIAHKVKSGQLSVDEGRALAQSFDVAYPNATKLDRLLERYLGKTYRSPAAATLNFELVRQAAVEATGSTDPDIYLIAGLQDHPNDPAWYLEAKNPVRTLYAIASSQQNSVALEILLEYLARGGKLNLQVGQPPVSKEELEKTVPEVIATAREKTLFAGVIYGSSIFNASSAAGKIQAMLGESAEDL